MSETDECVPGWSLDSLLPPPDGLKSRGWGQAKRFKMRLPLGSRPGSHSTLSPAPSISPCCGEAKDSWVPDKLHIPIHTRGPMNERREPWAGEVKGGWKGHVRGSKPPSPSPERKRKARLVGQAPSGRGSAHPTPVGGVGPEPGWSKA